MSFIILDALFHVLYIIFQFSKNTVLDCYLSFVENFKTSGKEIENILQNKSSIQKFIEVSNNILGWDYFDHKYQWNSLFLF